MPLKFNFRLEKFVDFQGHAVLWTTEVYQGNCIDLNFVLMYVPQIIVNFDSIAIYVNGQCLLRWLPHLKKPPAGCI